MVARFYVSVFPVGCTMGKRMWIDKESTKPEMTAAVSLSYENGEVTVYNVTPQLASELSDYFGFVQRELLAERGELPPEEAAAAEAAPA